MATHHPMDQPFPRISKPVELMLDSYDCVVIGSGYGGGVAASRMSRAGQSVCLLERGKERWPGEYPVTTSEVIRQLHTSGQFPSTWLNKLLLGRGDQDGMFHLIFGKGQSALVGNGLGGTSLMNSNVFLEADPASLSMKAWPPEICDDPDCLKSYYQMAREVLEPQPYPADFPELPKVELLRKQAEVLGMSEEFHTVPQTTRFHDGPNSCGVEMSGSTLTGQDATGVNDGSKTTTLVTYLADAWNWGSDIFCQCEVQYIRKSKQPEGGYDVYFAWRGRNRNQFKENLYSDLMWVHAKHAVFLGAGALGTTEILLRSREMGLTLSDEVGQNMSGNGDIMAFGYNTDYHVNATGRTHTPAHDPVGPTVNSMIDHRFGHENPLDGFVIQEGAIPRAFTPFLQAAFDLMPGNATPGGTYLRQAQAMVARWSSRLLGPYFKGGAVAKTQVYLVMSHDSNQATLTLSKGKPLLEFLRVGDGTRTKYIMNLLARATEAVGGTLIRNPFFALMADQQVTVHPMGGANMARDGTGRTGVTNHRGEVFVGSDTSETHPGLIVVDGAMIPAALGVNPLATITALAERAVEQYARSRGLVINNDRNGVLDLFGEPANGPRNVPKPKTENRLPDSRCHSVQSVSLTTAGYGFTEVMSGYLHNDLVMTRDVVSSYETAYHAAKGLCKSARLFLSVQATESTAGAPSTHQGILTGTLVCPSIPGSPFAVRRGRFSPFRRDPEASATKNLIYDFDMKGVDGRNLHFHGYKIVDSSAALNPMQFWRSTTTLYVKITENAPGADDTSENITKRDWQHGKPVAMGIMHVQPMDFLTQMLTLLPTGANLITKLRASASFMTYFLHNSLSSFLSPLAPLEYPTHTYQGFINNTLPSESYDIVATDGVRTKMHRWDPEPNAMALDSNGVAVPIKNILLIPGGAVDHRIWALPTIPYNAVNYFTRAGYRVFVCVNRIGHLRVARDNWTTFDARLDIKSCIQLIRALEGDKKVYVVAHCLGSVALASGLLDGTIPACWISGITGSQVFMNPIWGRLNMIKAKVRPPLDKVYSALAGHWYDCSTSPDDRLVQRTINQILRLYPQERRELCNSAGCHRISFVFGRCWNHRNINEATHRHIDHFFGGVNMTMQRLLMRMGVVGEVMGNAPFCEVLTTPHNVRRLKGIPIFLFVGGDNVVLSPCATEKTYDVLRDTFGIDAGSGTGEIEYRRRVVPGYGHLDCWMGRNAWKDVYPMVREEIDRVTRGEAYIFREPDDKFRHMVINGELLY